MLTNFTADNISSISQDGDINGTELQEIFGYAFNGLNQLKEKNKIDSDILISNLNAYVNNNWSLDQITLSSNSLNAILVDNNGSHLHIKMAASTSDSSLADGDEFNNLSIKLIPNSTDTDRFEINFNSYENWSIKEGEELVRDNYSQKDFFIKYVNSDVTKSSENVIITGKSNWNYIKNKNFSWIEGENTETWSYETGCYKVVFIDNDKSVGKSTSSNYNTDQKTSDQFDVFYKFDDENNDFHVAINIVKNDFSKSPLKLFNINIANEYFSTYTKNYILTANDMKAYPSFGLGDVIFGKDQTHEFTSLNDEAARVEAAIEDGLLQIVLAGANNITFKSALLEEFHAGSGNDSIVGSVDNNFINGDIGNDVIKGNAGNDTLDGGVGIDKLYGGIGDDVFVVDNVKDAIYESSNQGLDEVRASITWTIGANFEGLVLTGVAAINGTGNSIDNLIEGNDGKNTLSGIAGNDEILGGAGNDTLIGGAGNDTLTGDSGADIFRFDTALNANTNLDTITDFVSGTDKISLSKSIFKSIAKGVTADNLVAGGSNQVVQANDYLRFNATDHKLYYDADGSGNGAAVAVVELTGVNSLQASDFIIS